MHQKWKYIIANWINCYFYENNNKNEAQVNHESLLNIISHLRENFNLDESKSSIFGGHSLQEFISEKYPNFKFENGSTEVTTEEEIYIAASLLLFFVCVNSKDVDIKNAMCSKLNTSDQEVILKFSKSLIDCHSISSHDVLAAITEACGSEVANGEGSRASPMVAETPPALRSLHGEVRRLQAALDAERFDRNYLQDELARTNLKMEKLVRDKEQYKADIMDLKAKISMCCGQEAEARGDEGKSSEIAKLSKQLQQMEQRVVDTQEQLEEVQHERDTFKTKLEELKGECDRLSALSREEATRAGELAEELESEKRQSQTLRDLVIELRQHNHRNGFDTSLLECDDPDTSVQSLQRSFSVCSEVCANVVEVQLGEERARCLVLKQQIQSLQDNLNEQMQNTEILQKIIMDRENDIFNLKHRINEEIEEKNHLKLYCDNEVTKLNNIVNELEQKLKDNSKHSNLVIEKKMQDIQILQEEKLSLIQNLSDEITKSKNTIKDLKDELDNEKSLKLKMRDEYENIVMKMKEKVLNRNNELVELQNNVSKNSELIEHLNLELRKERSLKEEIINKCNKDVEFWNAHKDSLEIELQGKCAEMSELVNQIHERDACIDEMTKLKEDLLFRNNELVDLQNDILQKNGVIERQHLELRKEIDRKDEQIHKCNKNISLLMLDKTNLARDLERKCAELSELDTQIHQRDKSIDEMMKTKEEILNKNNELVELQNNVLQNSELIEQQNMELRKEMELKNEIIQKCNKDMQLLIAQKSNVEKDVQNKNEEITELLKQIHLFEASIVKMKENDLNKNNLLIELQNDVLQKNELITQLKKESELKDERINEYKMDVELLQAQKNQVKEDLQVKCVKITELVACINEMKEKEFNNNKELAELQNDVLQKCELIQQLNLQLDKENEIKQEIIDRFNKDMELFQSQKIEGEKDLQRKFAEITELDKKIQQREACIKEMKERDLHKNKELIELQNNVLHKTELIEQLNLKLEKEKGLKEETINKYNKDTEHLNEQIKRAEEDERTKSEEITELIKQIHQREVCIDEMKENSLKENEKLVELQNDILEKNELIGQLHLQLEQERVLKDATINKYNNDIELLNVQINRSEEYQRGKNEEITGLIKQIHERDACIGDMKEKSLKESKELVELQNDVLQKNELIEQLNLQLEKERESKNATINKYNKDIEHLSAQNNNAEEELQGKCQEIAELVKQIHQKDACIDEIKKKILIKSKELVELQNELLQKNELIEQLNLQLEKERKLKDTTINKYNKDLEILNAQKIKAEEELQGKCEKINELAKQIHQRDASLVEKIKELEYFKTTISKNNLDLTENLKQKLEIVTMLEEKLSNCDKNIVSLEMDKVSYQAKISQLEKEGKELTSGNKIMKSENDRLTTQKKEFELQIETLYKDIQELNDKVITLEEKNRELLNVREQEQLDINQLEEQIRQKENEKTKISQNFEKEKLKYLSEYNILKEKYSTVLEKVDKQNKELSDYQDIINNNNCVIKDLEQVRENLKHEKDCLIQEKKCNSMKMSKLEEEIKALTEELPILKETNINLTNVVEENKVAIEKVLNRNNELVELQTNVLQKMELIEQLNLELKKEMEMKDEMINKCKKEIEILSKQQEKVEKDLQNKCAEITELVKQLQQRDASIDELTQFKELYLNANNELVDLQNFVFQKGELIDQLNLELQKERELRDEIVHKFDKDIEIFNAQKYKFEEDFQGKCAEITELVKQIHQRDVSIEEVMKELEYTKTTCQQNNLEIAENLKQKTEIILNLEEKLLDCHKNIVSLETDNVKYQTLISQLEKEGKDLKDVNEIMKHENDKLTSQKKELEMQLATYHKDLEELNNKLTSLKEDNSELLSVVHQKRSDITQLEEQIRQEEMDITVIRQTFENEKLKYVSDYRKLEEKYSNTVKELDKQNKELLRYQDIINNNNNVIKDLEKASDENEKVLVNLKKELEILQSEKYTLVEEKNCNLMKINKLEDEIRALTFEELPTLKEANIHLTNIVEENKAAIATLEDAIKKEMEQSESLRKETSAEKLELIQKCNTLHENLQLVEQELRSRNNELNNLQEEFLKFKSEAAYREKELNEQNAKLTDIIEEKEALICKINNELSNEMSLKDQYKKEAESKENNIRELQNALKEEKDAMVEALVNQNKMLTKQIASLESNAAQERSPGQWDDGRADKNQDDLHPQVDCISSTNISNSDSNKTIRDLEIILNDKNRTITSLQIDINFLKSLMAESENKVLDLTKDLELSQENCQQLSNQLKKILHQKNEEIAELKNKISKMSAVEDRATQIIKVSAKYQEIIHKRLAEIKSNTVLKELTNFGNTATGESDLKRSFSSGTITMKDLESFLETTDRHIRRCSEKRFALQKERDRLLEVNRINESEIISVRKFLMELSVTVKTFNSVKEIYTQKLSRVVSLQRTVRREILNVEGRLTDTAVCKLERGYAATMQDLAECVMNLERWVERSIGRVVSSEKIKQAFTSESERNSLAPATFQNANIEAQMDQLESSFQKLLEEAVRAQKGDGAKNSLALTVQEVRAEYEEKLSRMKTKMKELYQKEVQSFKESQKEEVTLLHRELQSTKEKLRHSCEQYEKEIRSLSLELWNVGEKFLNKADEADQLRRKQRCDSLMSLQYVPSSGFGTQTEEPGRPSDTHSLRSLPVNMNNKKRESRGLHMSDEEGEVFDNRFLRELSTPRASHGQRLSELRFRNSLCPPHLKSSYPAETQFAAALHEDDIKACPTNASVGGRQQRKEVGITAYKKPGPPTPSKQAGRLSATDSELRESLRVEAEPQPRKTTTPSRLRSLFSSARSENVEGTPRSRRLSNFFRKK